MFIANDCCLLCSHRVGVFLFSILFLLPLDFARPFASNICDNISYFFIREFYVCHNNYSSVCSFFGRTKQIRKKADFNGNGGRLRRHGMNSEQRNSKNWCWIEIGRESAMNGNCRSEKSQLRFSHQTFKRVQTDISRALIWLPHLRALSKLRRRAKKQQIKNKSSKNQIE